jgi:concentrative nucleoside transporter, CNT family
MQRFQGLLGIVLILGIAFLVSNNKKRINFRLVFSGILLQVVIAVLVFKVSPVTRFFQWLGHGMQKIEGFAFEGAKFVYGGIVVEGAPGSFANYAGGGFVFAFNVTATIILVCVLVAIFYHFGIMQRIVAVISKAMNFVMRVSGAEALSNVASAFVGQVEAQVMIRPYLAGMTRSELLASMSGSLACIAGGILVVYSNMGERAGLDLAPKLIAASLMAAPGALVISKIVFPETEESQTMGKVKLEVKSSYTNIIDAISHGAGDGFKIAMNVIAMLIGFIALIACLDWVLVHIGHLINPNFDLSLNYIFGKIFYPIDAISHGAGDGFKIAMNVIAMLIGFIALIACLDWVLIKIGHLFNPDFTLSLNYIFGKLFTPIAYSMGIPAQDVTNASALLGQKLTINEFVAFNNLTNKTAPGYAPILSQKGLLIISIAICGFANFSSVGMQIGGIGELAPSRRADLAKLGLKALLCGTLASYLSATIAGILAT